MHLGTLTLYSFLLLTVVLTASNNDSSTNFLTRLMGSFHGHNSINISQFLSTFRMPACMKKCLPEIDGLLSALSKSNETADLASICNELQASSQCASSAGCSKVFLDATASAFQFVCLDNIQEISESMECVKDAADDIQPECEAHCAAQSLQSIDETSSRSLESIFEVPRLCNSTRCLLTCFKDKIDSKCRIGQQNMLDSLMSAMMRGEDYGFESALDWIMADTCQLKSSKHSSWSNISSPFSVSQVARSPSKTKMVPTNKETVRNNQVNEGNEVAADANRTTTKSSIDKPKAISGSKAVPMTVRLPPATKISHQTTEPVEAALIIDGEIRVLRYQLLDWQGKPVPSPDFETLAKIMTLQLLPFKFSSGRPREIVVLPSEDDEKAAEARVEEKIAVADQVDEADEGLDDNWRSEEDEEVNSDPKEVTSDGVGVAVGLLLFMATVFYWAWETARDLS